MGTPSKRRPVTGFRLDPDTSAAFQTALKARAMPSQQTLEGWVKRWLAESASCQEETLRAIRCEQVELRKVLESLAAQRSMAHPAEENVSSAAAGK